MDISWSAPGTGTVSVTNPDCAGASGSAQIQIQNADDLAFTGPLTIEREIANDRERQKKDIGTAVQLLEELREKIG